MRSNLKENLPNIHNINQTIEQCDKIISAYYWQKTIKEDLNLLFISNSDVCKETTLEINPNLLCIFSPKILICFSIGVAFRLRQFSRSVNYPLGRSFIESPWHYRFTRGCELIF